MDERGRRHLVQLRLAGTVIVVVPILVAVVATAIKGDGPAPSGWVMVPLTLLAILSHLMCDLFGYPPGTSASPSHHPPGAPALAQTLVRGGFVRLAMIAPIWAIGALLSLVTTPASQQTLLVASAMASFLAGLHVWPNHRVLRRHRFLAVLPVSSRGWLTEAVVTETDEPDE